MSPVELIEYWKVLREFARDADIFDREAIIDYLDLPDAEGNEVVDSLVEAELMAWDGFGRYEIYDIP